MKVIKLKVMSYKVKGKVLEKMNKIEEAIDIYYQAKDIAEKAFGNRNEMINELLIVINVASARKNYTRNH
jgi:hypothetical protein